VYGHTLFLARLSPRSPVPYSPRASIAVCLAHLRSGVSGAIIWNASRNA
jgi:hypothetical protein